MCFLYEDTGLHVDLTTSSAPEPDPVVLDDLPF